MRYNLFRASAVASASVKVVVRVIIKVCVDGAPRDILHEHLRGLRFTRVRAGYFEGESGGHFE